MGGSGHDKNVGGGGRGEDEMRGVCLSVSQHIIRGTGHFCYVVLRSWDYCAVCFGGPFADKDAVYAHLREHNFPSGNHYYPSRDEYETGQKLAQSRQVRDWLESSPITEGGSSLFEKSRTEVIGSWTWQTRQKFWTDVRVVNDGLWTGGFWPTDRPLRQPAQDVPAGGMMRGVPDEREQHVVPEAGYHVVDGHEDEQDFDYEIELDEDAAQDYYDDLVLAPREVQRMRDEIVYLGETVDAYEDVQWWDQWTIDKLHRKVANWRWWYNDQEAKFEARERTLKGAVEDLKRQHWDDQQMIGKLHGNRLSWENQEQRKTIAKLHTNVADWRWKFEGEAVRHSAVVRALQQRDLEIAALQSKLTQQNDGVRRGFMETGPPESTHDGGLLRGWDWSERGDWGARGEKNGERSGGRDGVENWGGRWEDKGDGGGRWDKGDGGGRWDKGDGGGWGEGGWKGENGRW